MTTMSAGGTLLQPTHTQLHYEALALADIVAETQAQQVRAGTSCI